MQYASKIFWKLLSFGILVLFIIALFNFATNNWTMDAVLEFFITSAKHGVPTVIALVILYKLFIERIVLHFQRKQSAKIIAEDLNQVAQISGDIRVGKDASTVGAAIIVGEYIIKKEKKELAELRDSLYIYDFKKLNNWLDDNGEVFFVSSEKRIHNVFCEVIKKNDCFINPYWNNKGITSSKHYYRWTQSKDKLVPDVAFNDGLYPGGKPFLDMLKKYVLLYMYHHFVPNFIMSNQPILEKYTIVKRKNIHRLFSKKLSQDYFKLKKDTPMPFPLRGFLIETELLIFYSNTDGKGESDFKKESGMREFYTTVGHLLREKVFLYGITQSPYRTMKALRELFPSYQHIFKMQFKSTANTKRFILTLRVLFKKFTILRFKLYLVMIPKFRISNLIIKYLTRSINYKKRKVSMMNQRKVRLFNKGYLIFYKGIYEHLADVGKKVKFPTFGLRKENKSENSFGNFFGFKQVNKISDSFGRYDTHIMRFIREQKEILHNFDFTKVPNWEHFKIDLSSALFMSYKQFESILQVSIAEINEIKKKKDKREKKRTQENNLDHIPELEELQPEELIILVKDFKLNEGYKRVLIELKTNLVNILAEEYEQKEKARLIEITSLPILSIKQLKELMNINDLTLELENINVEYRSNVIDLLVKEYKKFNK